MTKPPTDNEMPQDKSVKGRSKVDRINRQTDEDIEAMPIDDVAMLLSQLGVDENQIIEKVEGLLAEKGHAGKAAHLRQVRDPTHDQKNADDVCDLVDGFGLKKKPGGSVSSSDRASRTPQDKHHKTQKKTRAKTSKFNDEFRREQRRELSEEEQKLRERLRENDMKRSNEQ